MLRQIARLFGLQPIPKTATGVIQTLNDMGAGDPGETVDDWAAVWTGDFGWAWHVAEDKRAEFADRLRELADTIRSPPSPRRTAPRCAGRR